MKEKFPMFRVVRIKSNSGIYHIMTRGINRQNIFFSFEDYGRFLNTFLFHVKPETQRGIWQYLKGLDGCSFRQLARLTGLTVNRVVRA